MKIFRFGCANNVGLSVWGEELQITLPKPGEIHENSEGFLKYCIFQVLQMHLVSTFNRRTGTKEIMKFSSLMTTPPWRLAGTNLMTMELK